MQYSGTINQIMTKLKFTGFDKEKVYDIEITEHKNKRSLNANSYAWSLLTQLSQNMNIPKEELYKRYVKELNFYKEVELNNEAYQIFKKGWEHNGIAWMCEKVDQSRVHAYYGSSVYNTKQMSQLIDNIVQDCKQVGIEVLEDKKIQSLLKDWENR